MNSRSDLGRGAERVTEPSARDAAGRPLETILPTVVLMSLTAITAIGFCRVFDGWEFLRPMLTVGLGVHVIALALRLVKVPGYVALPIELGALFALVAWKYYPSTLSGPLPSSRTWQFLSSDLQLAREQFPDAVAPVAAVGGFVVGATFAVGVAALLADAFAFRAYGRAEAAVPSAVLFIFAAALGVDNHRVAVTAGWLAAALALIAVLRASHSQSEHAWIGKPTRVLISVIPLAGLLAGCAALGGAVIGPRLPGAGAEGLVDTKGRNETVEVLSPLVDIRSRIVNLREIEMFSVASDAPHYWRATGLSIFNGTTWRVLETSLESVSGTFDEQGSSPVLNQNVLIAGLEGNLLPAAFSPVGINGGGASWVSDTGTLVIADGLSRGDSFNIVSAVPNIDPATLSQATSDNPPDPSTASLPDDFPESAEQVANEVTVAYPTVYEKMLALQSWFQTNFTYDIGIQKGHGNNAIENFLRIRRGYCEQFAGTFAAMARSLGIPARVAVGFTPGELKADGRYHVYGRNAHAWPEIWFDGVGWVSFDPTPGRGEPGTQDYTGNEPAQETVESDLGGGDGTPISLPDEPTVTTLADDIPGAATTVPDPNSTTTTTPATSANSSDSDGSGPSSTTLVVLALVLLAGAWLYAMPRAVASLRARGRSHQPVDVIANSWLRAARSLALVGLGPEIGETPIEHAARIGQAIGLEHRTLRNLAQSATAAMYGGLGDESTARRCLGLSEQIVRSARSRFNVGQRITEWFDPRRVRLMTL